MVEHVITDRRIVAGAFSLTSTMLFRARPIIKIEDLYVEVIEWRLSAEGPCVSGFEFSRHRYRKGLLHGPFTKLPRPIEAVEGAQVWVFQPDHPRRAQAICDLVVLAKRHGHEVVPHEVGDALVCVVGGGEWREALLWSWHREAEGRAREFLANQELEQAWAEAKLSRLLAKDVAGAEDLLAEIARRQGNVDEEARHARVARKVRERASTQNVLA